MSSITLNTGAGGASLATDQVAGVDYQKVKVTFSTDGVAPVSVDATHGLPTNLVLVGGNAVKAGSGIGSTGSLNVYLATDQPSLSNALPVSQSGSWTVAVSGTVPVSGTFWQATQPVSIAGNQGVNVAQVAGTATDTNSGNKSAGTQRVVIATDQPSLANALPVSQSGTWTVQPGNTANTTPWLTTNVPGTSPGSTQSRVKAAASTNATNLKGSAGVVLGYALYNNTASAKFFKFYNKATAPTIGTDTPVFTIIIPASGGANLNWADGVPFATGIGYGITGAVGDSDTTATAADDVHGVVLWK